MIGAQLATLNEVIGVDRTHRLVALMLDAIRDAEPDLREAVEQGDHARVATLCHQLLGPAGSLGADELSAVCRRLEHAAAQPEDDGLGALLVEWRTLARQASCAFEQHLSAS